MCRECAVLVVLPVYNVCEASWYIHVVHSTYTLYVYLKLNIIYLWGEGESPKEAMS